MRQILKRALGFILVYLILEIIARHFTEGSSYALPWNPAFGFAVGGVVCWGAPWAVLLFVLASLNILLLFLFQQYPKHQ